LRKYCCTHEDLLFRLVRFRFLRWMQHYRVLCAQSGYLPVARPPRAPGEPGRPPRTFAVASSSASSAGCTAHGPHRRLLRATFAAAGRPTGRYPFHGGLSTGPRTGEGRERISGRQNNLGAYGSEARKTQGLFNSLTEQAEPTPIASNNLPIRLAVARSRRM
jgi:hypothetical protein